MRLPIVPTMMAIGRLCAIEGDLRANRFQRLPDGYAVVGNGAHLVKLTPAQHALALVAEKHARKAVRV